MVANVFALALLSTTMAGCTAGAPDRAARNTPFEPLGSTRFVPGVGCGPERTLVGNRCVSLDNDRF